MKRTLTAAAVLAGSAGALGFAGTANAAEAPGLLAELPVDSNNVADTTYHLAGTVQSATKVVGDVVPAEKGISGRAGDGSPVGSLTTAVLDSSPNDVIGWVVGSPEQGDSGQAPAGEPAQSPSVQGRAGEVLPLNDVVLAGRDLPSILGDVTNSLPNLTGETRPAQPSPAKDDERAGRTEAKDDERAGLTGGTPLAGVLPPVTAEPHAVVDKLDTVVNQGPLGEVTNLVGN